MTDLKQKYDLQIDVVNADAPSNGEASRALLYVNASDDKYKNSLSIALTNTTGKALTLSKGVSISVNFALLYSVLKALPTPTHSTVTSKKNWTTNTDWAPSLKGKKKYLFTYTNPSAVTWAASETLTITLVNLTAPTDKPPSKSKKLFLHTSGISRLSNQQWTQPILTFAKAPKSISNLDLTCQFVSTGTSNSPDQIYFSKGIDISNTLQLLINNQSTSAVPGDPSSTIVTIWSDFGTDYPAGTLAPDAGNMRIQITENKDNEWQGSSTATNNQWTFSPKGNTLLAGIGAKGNIQLDISQIICNATAGWVNLYIKIDGVPKYNSATYVIPFYKAPIIIPDVEINTFTVTPSPVYLSSPTATPEDITIEWAVSGTADLATDSPVILTPVPPIQHPETGDFSAPVQSGLPATPITKQAAINKGHWIDLSVPLDAYLHSKYANTPIPISKVPYVTRRHLAQCLTKASTNQFKFTMPTSLIRESEGVAGNTSVIAITSSQSGGLAVLTFWQPLSSSRFIQNRHTILHGYSADGDNPSSIAIIPPNDTTPTQLEFTADGKNLLLLCTAFDGNTSSSLQVYPVQSSSQPITIPLQLDDAHSLAITPDGRYALCGGTITQPGQNFIAMMVFSLSGNPENWGQSGTIVLLKEIGYPINSIAVTEDSKYALIVNKQSVVYVIQLESYLNQWKPLHTAISNIPADTITVAPNGRYAVISHLDVSNNTASMNLIDLTDPDPTNWSPMLSPPIAIPVKATTPRTPLLISAYGDNTIQLYNGYKVVSSFDFSPNIPKNIFVGNNNTSTDRVYWLKPTTQTTPAKLALFTSAPDFSNPEQLIPTTPTNPYVIQLLIWQEMLYYVDDQNTVYCGAPTAAEITWKQVAQNVSWIVPAEDALYFHATDSGRVTQYTPHKPTPAFTAF